MADRPLRATSHRECFCVVVEARKPLTVVMPLRHSWSERTLLPDSVAAEIQAKMSDCHRQVHFNLQPKRGYGASLNVWMGALCVAMQQNMSLVANYDWKGGYPWNGPRDLCSSAELATPLACHFGRATNPCHRTLRRRAASDQIMPSKLSEAVGWNHSLVLTPSMGFTHMAHGQAVSGVWPGCPDWSLRTGKGGKPENFLVAAADFLFSHMPAGLEHRAATAATEVFGSLGAPSSLISVHIRWGDKGGEMELLPILRYIGAIEKITAARGLFGANVHVFVMTEDRAALREFRTQAKPRGWRIYAYEKAIVQTSQRASTNSNLTNVANKLNASAEERRGFYNALIARRAASRIAPPPVAHAAGGMGMHSLIALILTMEAEHYVLTISSSWSKLVNALRLALFPKHKRGDADLLFSREFGHWKTSDPLHALGYIDAGNTVSADSFNAIEYMADYSSVSR